MSSERDTEEAGAGWLGSAPGWQPYVRGSALVALATVCALFLEGTTAASSLLWLYALAILITAVSSGLYPALWTAVVSIVTFELLFVPPTSTLRIADTEILVPVASLLAGGVLVAALAVRAYQRELAARGRESEALALFDLSKQLTAVSDLPEVAQTSVRLAGAAVGRDAALFTMVHSQPNLRLQAATPGFKNSADIEGQVDRLYRQQLSNSPEAESFVTEQGIYLFPILSGSHTLGILTLADNADARELTREQQALLIAFTSLVGFALERADLAAASRQARLLEETDRLQTALLNSISHDLRTPLASVTGALSSLLEDEALLTASARRDLLLTAWEESIRLNRLLRNLLDMTRLESGALQLRFEPADVEELVGAALAQMPRRLEGRSLALIIPQDLPPISIDLGFMVQALVNLVDNALKYSPPELPIEISARTQENMVIVEVKDRGPGLPAQEAELIFNKFTRGSNVGGSGTGLGLSIAKGIVEAHNGQLWAENRGDGGAVFAMALSIADLS